MINEIELFPQGIINETTIITYEFLLHQSFIQIGHLSYDISQGQGSGEFDSIAINFQKNNSVIKVQAETNFEIHNIFFNKFKIITGDISFVVSIDRYEHTAKIDNSANETTYLVPMAMNTTPITIIKGLLNIITRGRISRCEKTIIVPKNFNYDDEIKLALLISITILRLVYYQTDFSQPAN